MQVSFPFPVRLRAVTPVLEGLRLDPFTNVNGEPFARPTMNGFWRVSMDVVARATDMQAKLALSSFITQMSAAGTACVIPICTQYRPNDRNGRPLSGCDMAPEYTFDHVGFLGDPFDGYTLRSAVSHRDSYINVNTPALSKIWPGMFITLGDRLYQVVNAVSINESDRAWRLSVMPNIRGNHANGSLVIVDQLRLKVAMESGEQIGLSPMRTKFTGLSFVEAF